MSARPLIALALLLAACGSDASADPDSSTAATPAPTVPGVGRLPDSVPDTASNTTSTEPPIEVDVAPMIEQELAGLDGPIADQVDGNRLLVIGDSILASTATRYGREMCDALNPMGWDVEVDAEPGRFVDFGLRVLDRRLPDESDADSDEDFDAAIVHLGSNYRRDQEAYFEDLAGILDQLAPRPTLLYTVTEYRPEWSEVNDVIEALAEVFENVTMIDWEDAARTPGVLSSDGLHPTNAGEEVLVGLAGAALGELEDASEGECLRSSFTDDSAIRSGGGTPNGSSSSSGSSGGGSSSSSTSGSGSSGGSSSGGSGSTGGSSSTTPTTTNPSGSTGGSSTGGSSSTVVPTTTVGSSTGGGTTGGDTTGGDTTGGDSTGGDSTGGDSTGGDSTGGDSTGGSTGGGSGTTSPPSTSPPATSPPTVATTSPPVVTSPPTVATTSPPPPPSQPPTTVP